MLVLTRYQPPNNPGEDSILIHVPMGGGSWKTIRVVLIGQRGKGVRLGIDADQDVTIVREEIAGRNSDQIREGA